MQRIIVADCWKCHKALEDGKIMIRAACPHCGADLHVCKNCRHYAPGKPNDCAVPGTDPIRDREAANFCEEFSPRLPPTKPPASSSPSNIKRIFGEDIPKKKNPLLGDLDFAIF